jgi:hypothetical protein
MAMRLMALASRTAVGIALVGKTRTPVYFDAPVIRIA